MKKYLENDDDVEILETWKDLKEYLTFREKHDEWVQLFINELAAIGIPNHPYFSRQTAQICPYRKTDTGLMSKISTMRIQKI